MLIVEVIGRPVRRGAKGACCCLLRTGEHRDQTAQFKGMQLSPQVIGDLPQRLAKPGFGLLGQTRALRQFDEQRPFDRFNQVQQGGLLGRAAGDCPAVPFLPSFRVSAKNATGGGGNRTGFSKWLRQKGFGEIGLGGWRKIRRSWLTFRPDRP